MDVPRLGVELELQLLGYTTAMATWDPSHISNLYHSSQQHQILNLLSEARDQTSWILVRFVTAESRWKLLYSYTFILHFSPPQKKIRGSSE